MHINAWSKFLDHGFWPTLTQKESHLHAIRLLCDETSAPKEGQ